MEKENEEMTLRKNHTLFNSDHLITTGYTTLKKNIRNNRLLLSKNLLLQLEPTEQLTKAHDIKQYYIKQVMSIFIYTIG